MWSALPVSRCEPRYISVAPFSIVDAHEMKLDVSDGFG